MYRPPGAPQPLAAEQAAWQQRPGRVPDQPGLYHQQQGAGVQPQGGYGYPPPRPSAAAAAHPPPPTADGRLRSVDELPPPFRPCFRFRYFNAIQNESWGAIWEGDSNVVISAPTGGGAHGWVLGAGRSSACCTPGATRGARPSPHPSANRPIPSARQDGAAGAGRPAPAGRASHARRPVPAPGGPPEGCVPGSQPRAGAGGCRRARG